ncbi:MAG TPA: SPOR domain-containing protein [Gemmatimonadaceae bacterium]|nr:SPOR domain-containing protein [Gemmatimonadaceae bacterium]
MRPGIAGRFLLGCALALGTAQGVQAQGTDSVHTAASAADSAFARARALVQSGKRDAGRQVVDSILAATPVTSPAYGDALYWRGTLAATAADAEQDYNRVIVEFPLASHAGDALLGLAQLEMSRGDRASATGNLQRYIRENGIDSTHANAGLWLARLLFEQGQDAPACSVLGQARAVVPAGNVELRNQMDYYTEHCADVAAQAARDSAAAAAAAAAAAPPPPKARPSRREGGAASGSKKRSARDTSSATPPAPTRDTSSATPPAPTRDTSAAAPPARERDTSATTAHAPATKAGRYAIQVAAYATRTAADELAHKLERRGLDAHVDGARKPYRVRVGHYATRREADEAAAKLARAGVKGFVTTIDAR